MLAEHETAPRSLRILSYNVQVGITTRRYHHYFLHGWKHVLPYRGRQTTLDGIARFLSGFDLVGLQEVDAGSLRTGNVNQVEYLARAAGIPWWYSQTNRNFGQLAQHSLGLLSRYHPHTVIEHRLPGVVPGRGALEAHFGAARGDGSLVVVLVHLSLGRWARRMQFGYLSEMLRDHEHVVVMGDMNCACHSDEVRDLLRCTRLVEPEQPVKTWPSWRPRHAYDHILVTPGLGVQEVRAYNLDYSDHLPVGMEIAVPANVSLARRPGI